MTIQEALKVNETQKVRDPQRFIWEIGRMREVQFNGTFNGGVIVGEWTVVREPEVVEFETAGDFISTKHSYVLTLPAKIGLKLYEKRWKVRCEEIVE